METEKTDKENIIDADGLKKIYKQNHFFKIRKTAALSDFSLKIEKNEVFGLLGPNGAGKTTAVKLMVGLLKPTAGTIKIMGGDIFDLKVREKVSYIPEFPYFSRYLTPTEILRFYIKLFNAGSRASKDKINDILTSVGLSKKAHSPLSQLSKGLQQRVGWAQGLINAPELLFIDEPMSGLDPFGIIEMRNLILEQKKMGKTVFFNSHILSEVEKVCDRVGIIVDGRLTVVTKMTDILSKQSLESFFISVVRSKAQ